VPAPYIQCCESGNRSEIFLVETERVTPTLEHLKVLYTYTYTYEVRYNYEVYLRGIAGPTRYTSDYS
jgi:hypothetical protein